MINFIDELKNYLVANAGLVFGTTIFIGKLPESLSSVVVLSTAPSPEYQYNYGDNFGYSQYNVLIRVRGTNKENETRTLAKTVQDAIENLTDETLGIYHLIRGEFETPMQQLDGTDENNKYVYVGVYAALIEL
ncbi:MAG: hypothetical protein KAX49_07230 [Halanaerobiales bacterium]|nr:hypothetical protein [Halanaerobiales bacterium]